MSTSVAPFISVLMNCYNSDLYLREAIESVIAQTFTDWEIIFWDNQSTDNSAAIVKSFDDQRIRYFYAPQHTPLGEARNLALQHVRGEWIAILDCDDAWSSDKLAAQVALIKDGEGLGLVYSDMYFCDKNLLPFEKGSERYRMRRGDVFGWLLTSRNFVPCAAAVMKTAAVREVGGFNSYLRYCEEYDLFLRIGRKYSFDFIDRPLVRYRIHSGNTTGFGTVGTTREALAIVRNQFDNGARLSAMMQLRYWLRVAFLRSRLCFQIFLHFVKSSVSAA